MINEIELVVSVRNELVASFLAVLYHLVIEHSIPIFESPTTVTNLFEALPWPLFRLHTHYKRCYLLTMVKYIARLQLEGSMTSGLAVPNYVRV